jgi:hypothetical protein
LFLVSSDLNVPLKFDQSPARVKLSDLKEGQRWISVTARIVSIGIPRRFEKSPKDGFLLKILLCDDSNVIVPCTVWDYPIGSRILTGANAGTLIKTTNSYTKSNLDGSQSLNIPDSSGIEILAETSPIAKTIPSAEKLAVNLTTATSQKSALQVVRGVVAETPRRTEFTRSKDSTQRYFLSFSLEPEGGSKETTRIVLWGNANPAIQSLKVGDTITVAGLRSKSNSFQGQEQIELHGDDSTIVLEKWQDTRNFLLEELVQIEKYFVKGKEARSADSSPIPFVSRILSLSSARDENSAHLLVIDSSARKISLTALDGVGLNSSRLQIDDVVLCKPDSFDEIGLKAVCKKEGSIAKIKPERKDIPKSDSLQTQIEKLEPGNIVSLDAMALSETVAREIQTKEGSLVRRTEVTLADASGEIKLFAWRSLSKSLEGLKPGMRVLIRAAEVQSHEGKKFLLLKNYSSVEPREET